MPDEETAAATGSTAVADPEDERHPEAPLPDPGTDMVIGEGASSILIPARYGFDQKQVEAIRKTVAADCSPAELVMFLELCARYGLDPFAKQIFAAKIGGAVQIIVSRDGLLAHAHKQDDYVNMDGDVVHENDTFEVEIIDGVRKVTHKYSGWKDRGEIVGAWAMVERKNHGKTYFFAPFSEYKGKNVWDKNPSAMIQKVPETYALRKAFSISGVVGEEEIARKRADVTALPDEPEWGDDEIMAERLQSLFDRANEVVPGSYRPQKVRTMLAGADAEKRREVAQGLEDFIERNAPEEEQVTDAVVVDEGGDGETKDETKDENGSADEAPEEERP